MTSVYCLCFQNEQQITEYLYSHPLFTPIPQHFIEHKVIQVVARYFADKQIPLERVEMVIRSVVAPLSLSEKDIQNLNVALIDCSKPKAFFKRNIALFSRARL